MSAKMNGAMKVHRVPAGLFKIAFPWLSLLTAVLARKTKRPFA
jgi:hypothetical protein